MLEHAMVSLLRFTVDLVLVLGVPVVLWVTVMHASRPRLANTKFVPAVNRTLADRLTAQTLEPNAPVLTDGDWPFAELAKRPGERETLFSRLAHSAPEPDSTYSS